MPKIPTPLQDTNIKSYKPKDKDYTKADGKGLHLLIKTSGVKIWEFVFISPLTKKRMHTPTIFGQPADLYPDT